MKQSLLLTACFLVNIVVVKASEVNTFDWPGLNYATLYQDTIVTQAQKDSVPNSGAVQDEADTIVYYNVNPAAFQFTEDTIQIKYIRYTPSVTVQQMVKGAVSGLYVQETTGEPGSVHQQMYVRGLSRPLLSPKELYLSQPAVYLN